MSNTGGADSKLWNREWKFYVGVAFPCIFGLLISNIITSTLELKKPERVTVSIECCYQNVGIATSVALTMFNGNNLAEAMGVPLYYGLLEAVILGAYCIWAWKANWTKAPNNAPFHHIISMSYEVLVAEKQELQAIEVSITTCASADETVSDDGNTIFATYFQLDHKMRKEPSGLKDAFLEQNKKGDEQNNQREDERL